MTGRAGAPRRLACAHRRPALGLLSPLSIASVWLSWCTREGALVRWGLPLLVAFGEYLLSCCLSLLRPGLVAVCGKSPPPQKKVYSSLSAHYLYLRLYGGLATKVHDHL